eukprot:TRINITY_DN26351_c0_g1_i1.p1 TRINITY_DN26351_c0_g1~~TRINITY_DN26351_c0_g1_i1.p1  ORF type:complete len:195 (+),score=8.21 TRINITY_DN26351_c0_g1_i1:223-807(+)
MVKVFRSEAGLSSTVTGADGIMRRGLAGAPLPKGFASPDEIAAKRVEPEDYLVRLGDKVANGVFMFGKEGCGSCNFHLEDIGLGNAAANNLKHSATETGLVAVPPRGVAKEPFTYVDMDSDSMSHLRDQCGNGFLPREMWCKDGYCYGLEHIDFKRYVRGETQHLSHRQPVEYTSLQLEKDKSKAGSAATAGEL